MKIIVAHDELWPWFYLAEKEDSFMTEIEVDVATFNRWGRISAEWGQMQGEMRRLSGYES